MVKHKAHADNALPTQKRDALDELYDECVSRTNNKRRLNSLHNLYKTLRHLLSVGSDVSSVAAIARSIQDLGFDVPKAQSIRNVEGKDFRDLIGAYATLSSAKESGKANDEESFVLGIVDLRVAAQVRWVLNENRSLKRRLDLLHAEFQRLQPIKLLSAAAPINESVSEDDLVAFTDIEIQAVKLFRTNLIDIDCVLDETSGALLYKGSFEVAPPGFGQALTKLAEKFGT